MRILILLTLTAFLTACTQSIVLDTPFEPSEHEYAAKPGKASVTGQAFMRRNDGFVVYAAGSPVYLIPDTRYTREIFDKGTASFGPVNLSNGDKRLVTYSRHTQADGEGRFSFSSIPDGPYLIVTGVVWMAGNARQGGDLTRFIAVKDGEDVETILTR